MVARKTVQAALDLGAEGVLVHCNACLNRRRFEPMPALKAFGGDTLISDIPKRLRCRCGAQNATAVAAWKRRSRGGAEPLPIVPKEWGWLP